jgi:hypothetical protein
MMIPPKLCAMKRMGRDFSWSLRFLASAFKRLFASPCTFVGLLWAKELKAKICIISIGQASSIKPCFSCKIIWPEALFKTLLMLFS